MVEKWEEERAKLLGACVIAYGKFRPPGISGMQWRLVTTCDSSCWDRWLLNLLGQIRRWQQSKCRLPHPKNFEWYERSLFQVFIGVVEDHELQLVGVATITAAMISLVFDTVIFTPPNGHLYLIQWSPSGSANTITAAMISLAFDAAIFTAMDTADLRQVMRAALQKTGDAEMLGVLGVGVSWNDTNCFKPLICVWILQDVISPLQLHIGSPDPDCFRASGMKTSIRWKED